MQLSFTQKKNIRKNFGKLIEGLSIPNLIEVQKNSYNEFLKSKRKWDEYTLISKEQAIKKLDASNISSSGDLSNTSLDSIKEKARILNLTNIKYIQGDIRETLKNSKIELFVNTSTSEVYGSAQYSPIDESHPLNAQSPYAATKISADQLCLSYYRSFSVKPLFVYTGTPESIAGATDYFNYKIPTTNK